MNSPQQNKTKITWRVCQGSYGVRVIRSDKAFPGGKQWNGFILKKDAIAAASLICKGEYRPPDSNLVELSRVGSANRS